MKGRSQIRKESGEGMITTIEIRREPAFFLRDTARREWYINQKGRVLHIVYHQRGKKIRYALLRALLMPGGGPVLCSRALDERALGAPQFTFRGASLRGLEEAALAWGERHPGERLCLVDPDARFYFTAEKLFRRGLRLTVVTNMTHFYTRMAQQQKRLFPGQWTVTDRLENAPSCSLVLHPERISSALPTPARVFTLYPPTVRLPNPVCTHFLPPADEAVLSLKPPGVDLEGFLNLYEYAYPAR